MTTSSSEFPGYVYQHTMRNMQPGIRRFKGKEAVGRMVVVCGMGEKIYQMTQQKSLMKTVVQSFATCLIPLHNQQKIENLHTPTLTSTNFWLTWGSNGRPPSQSHLERRSHTWAFVGTCTCELYTFMMRKRLGIWQSLLNGERGAPMISSRCRSCMESSYMQHWSSLQDVLISPAWRPCSPLSTIVLSTLTPLPGAPQNTWTGGSTNFASLTSPFPSPNHNPSPTTRLTQMTALDLAWQSLSGQDGERGA